MSREDVSESWTALKSLTAIEMEGAEPEDQMIALRIRLDCGRCLLHWAIRHSVEISARSVS